MPQERITPAESICGFFDANVDNDKINDADFRQLVRDNLETAIYKAPVKGYEADRRDYK